MALTGPMKRRRSNAKTAYDLMTDIRAYILEEPKRIYMADWIIQGKDRIELQLATEAPICGTVGCIAGNATVLTDGKIDWSRAEQALSNGDAILEGGFAKLFYDTKVPAEYGTKKYARIVAGRITDFQKKYKAKLQRAAI